MTLRSTIATGNQMANDKTWECFTGGSVITRVSQPPTVDFCTCEHVANCPELAFTNLEDAENEYENDYKKVVVNLSDATSTVDFFIVSEDGTETPFDATLGEVFPAGFNTVQPLMAVINVQWVKVANVLGFGNYTIKYTQTDFTKPVTFVTHVYQVVPFVAERAQGTVKIEVKNVGTTMNGKNWAGLGEFFQMYRVYGKLDGYSIELEPNELLNSQRVNIYTQTSKVDSYTLKIEELDFKVGQTLIVEDTVMNWVITDYNVLNWRDYRKLELKPKDASTDDIPWYNKRFFEIELTDPITKLSRPFV